MDKFLADPINETGNVAMEEIEEERDIVLTEELDQDTEEETKSEPEEKVEKGTDPVGLYFRDISSIPLLTREQEVQLGKQGLTTPRLDQHIDSRTKFAQLFDASIIRSIIHHDDFMALIALF